MSYTKATDFAAKDVLLQGDPLKLVKGTELGAEFDAIQVADALNMKTATLSASGGSALVGFIQAGTGATATTVQAKMRDSVSVKDFGAVGDGVTNDYTAFSNALAAASGKRLEIPAGTYLIEFTGGTACFTPPTNIVIEGDGDTNTTITFAPTDSATLSRCFQIDNAGFELRNVTINCDVVSTRSISFFQQNANDIVFENCTFDGEVTNSGSTISHSAYCWVAEATGTHDGLMVRRSKITRLTYPYLKSNASTSTQTRLRFIDNHFTTNYYNDLGLNSPNGAMDDVVVSGNTFENNQSEAASITTQNLAIALASVTNAVISGNTINGAVQGVHIEEGSYFIAVTGNTISVDPTANGGAIYLNGNNIGGSTEYPQFITITGNTLYKLGTAKEATTYGIVLTTGGGGFPPANSIIVSNNMIYSFETGIYVTAVEIGKGVVFSDNFIENCTNGMQLAVGSPTITRNITKSCTTGVKGGVGGTTTEAVAVYDHHFIDCTTNASQGDFETLLVNPSFEFASFSHTAGNTDKELLPANTGERGYGVLTTSITSDVTFDRSYRASELTWDGTTLTDTQKVAFTVGWTVTSIVSGNVLYIRCANATNESNVRLQAKLNGMYVVST